MTPPTLRVGRHGRWWVYLGVPDVEDTGVGGPDDLETAPDVLAVQEHILQSPARHLVLEPSHSQEVRPVNTSDYCSLDRVIVSGDRR